MRILWITRTKIKWWGRKAHSVHALSCQGILFEIILPVSIWRWRKKRSCAVQQIILKLVEKLSHTSEIYYYYYYYRRPDLLQSGSFLTGMQMLLCNTLKSLPPTSSVNNHTTTVPLHLNMVMVHSKSNEMWSYILQGWVGKQQNRMGRGVLDKPQGFSLLYFQVFSLLNTLKDFLGEEREKNRNKKYLVPSQMNRTVDLNT